MLKQFDILHHMKHLHRTGQKIAKKCNGCDICQKECAFLRKYGTPKTIMAAFESDPATWMEKSFECSLCGLCTAVCPIDLDPAAMFLFFRIRAVKSGKGCFTEHRRLINYEKKGISKRFSYYALPENCDTVYFPGCALPGARPDTTWKSYLYLQQHVDNIGMVLDCCTKPSHDLGRIDYFTRIFSELKLYLLENGIRTILLACPSCNSIFTTYAPEFNIKTIYEIMAEKGVRKFKHKGGDVIIHDPCATRFEHRIHEAIRKIACDRGMTVIETGHQREKTLCCGEGGAAGCLAPEFKYRWSSERIKEAGSRMIASYCAGCVSLQQRKIRSFHILDLVLAPRKTVKNKAKLSRAPITYLNRLLLKKKLKKIKVKASRERNFPAG